MKPEPAHRPNPTMCTNGWREIIQSGADGVGVEGLTLEQLIDLQRAHARQEKEMR